MTLDSGNEDRHRIDKWLWHVRFFKTRSLAAAAVSGGRVKLDGERVKPAHALRIGQLVAITLEQRTVQVAVLALPARRGTATLAQACYAETPASIASNALHREQRRIAALSRPLTEHRPDKRERRQLDQLRRRQG
jgi:ribosome-associated heat shock protein Hsp15